MITVVEETDWDIVAIGGKDDAVSENVHVASKFDV